MPRGPEPAADAMAGRGSGGTQGAPLPTLRKSKPPSALSGMGESLTLIYSEGFVRARMSHISVEPVSTRDPSRRTNDSAPPRSDDEAGSRLLRCEPPIHRVLRKTGCFSLNP